jgi:hypothetical protein
MAVLKSTRFAWAVATASLILWAASAPVTWGQVVGGATRLLQQTPDEAIPDGPAVQDAACPTPPSPQPSDVAPSQAPAFPALPTMTLPAPASTGQPNQFRVCGADPQLAQRIEQVIAGRGFSTTLSSRDDGCADLLVSVTSPAITSGRASSTVNVGLGSGQMLSIQIVSEGGATRVSIGAGH